MSNYYVLIPRHIATPIIESQILDRFRGLEVIYIDQYGHIDKSNNQYNVIASVNLQAGDTVYIRSVFDAALLILKKQILRKDYKIDYDFRGVISEESYLRSKSKFKRRILCWLERYVYKYSTSITTVSGRLKHELISRFGIRDITVIPCCVPDSYPRRRYFMERQKLHFCYLGSLSSWQGFSKAVDLYASIEGKCDAHLSVFTNERGKAIRICENAKLRNFSCFSLNRDEVAEHLDGVDFGFLLRDNNVINKTASPVKFCEYIGRGVVPILTDNVGDFSVLAKKSAYILNDGETQLNFDRLNKLLTDRNFESIYKLSKSFTWSNYKNVLQMRIGQQ